MKPGLTKNNPIRLPSWQVSEIIDLVKDAEHRYAQAATAETKALIRAKVRAIVLWRWPMLFDGCYVTAAEGESKRVELS